MYIQILKSPQRWVFILCLYGQWGGIDFSERIAELKHKLNAFESRFRETSSQHKPKTGFPACLV